MKHVALVWLLVVGCAAGVLLFRLHQGAALQTDLTALLVQQRGDAKLRAATDRAAANLAQRVFILAGDNDRVAARTAGAEMADALERSGLTAAVTYRLPTDSLSALATAYFPFRFGLLTGEERDWLQHNEGRRIVARALATIYGPGAIADAAMLRRDPFMLLPAFLIGLPMPFTKVALDDEVLTVHDGTRTWVLVTAQLKGNVYSLAVQDRFIATFDATTTELRRRLPGLTIARVGAVFYAHQGAQSAVSEAGIITAVSLIGTIVLILLVFRDLRPLLLTLLAIGVGVLCAFSVCLSVYGGVHVVVLLFGVSLTGIAIDYCLQYITARFGPDAGSAQERLSRVLPGITIGVITTLIGYLTLTLAPFPGLRQLAVFSAIGLAGSFITVILWLPALDSAAPLSDSASVLPLANLLWLFWEDEHYRRLRIAFVAVCLVAGSIGLARLTVDDDLRHQQALSADLRAEELQIRRLTGMTDGSQFILVQGSDNEIALQREETLLDRLEAARKTGVVSGFEATAQFVPSIKRQQEDRALVRKRLMEPFLNDYYRKLGVMGGMLPAAPDNIFLTPARLMAGSPLTFLRNLTLVDGPLGTTQIVLLNGVTRANELRRIAEAVPGVHFADPAGEVTEVLAEYRRRATILLAISVLLMMPVLMWRYGWRGSLATLWPPAAAVLLAPAVAALAGVAFTFFSAIALMLVLSIGFDYAVFCREAAPARRAVTMLGVCLAMIATLLSFGLLAFSRTYAVHSFGTTLLIGTIMAFLLAPLASDHRRRL